ncbi:carboxypeptidase regulatory-like domain-containing protein [Halanaerobiaceae bacterium Z-7014]|uniref:Carboxypeptidase regulatory-like domain-containing protein n=1 Tax=Halonatronomonas betaini TaxID=2778430 RepID=A0A931AP46_9FIRM|nr:carboxypeptidase-like regulatory domain-containing protein [Halonatronomonas betaini]MBF8436312.1 carboxypeptidase regulatory-like domain-containing protein [Halonatronomonas betaini]
MRNIKKIVFSIMVLFVVFAITGCSSSSDIVTFTGDRPVRGEVSGTVVETFSDDNPVEDARIVRTDSNSVTYSESDGNYRLEDVDNNTEITVTRDGYEPVSRTVEVEEDGQTININFRLYKEYSEDDESDSDNGNEESTISADLLFELNWQEGVEDLDAHLIVPDSNDSSQEGYHIYYQDQGSRNSYPYAELDQDILTYENNEPETIRIERLYEGRYIYFIKNFSMYDSDNREDVPEISDSEAMVRVRENGEWTEYEAPTDENGMHWHLFDIIVDENGYEIDYINEFTDDEPGLD